MDKPAIHDTIGDFYFNKPDFDGAGAILGHNRFDQEELRMEIDHVKEAAIARCDLNILYGVIAILEGGTISSAHHADVSAIIKRCKSGAQKALVRYDRHCLAARKDRDDG